MNVKVWDVIILVLISMKRLSNMSNLRLGGDTSIDYSICLGDVCDEALSTAHISRFLKGLKKQRVDFVLSHPPYWDIVKFTDNEAGLSQSKTLDRFFVSIPELN